MGLGAHHVLDGAPLPDALSIEDALAVPGVAGVERVRPFAGQTLVSGIAGRRDGHNQLVSTTCLGPFAPCGRPTHLALAAKGHGKFDAAMNASLGWALHWGVREARKTDQVL